MESQAENPYKAPEAEVETASQGHLSEVFERFTAWGVFGLSIITLGIYPLYWLYTRTQQLNSRIDNPISSAYMITTIVIWIISMLSNGVTPINPQIGGIMALAGLPAAIMQIVWAFKIRSRIHDYVTAAPGTFAWANSFLTFFLGALYLQYKINKIIDNQ